MYLDRLCSSRYRSEEFTVDIVSLTCWLQTWDTGKVKWRHLAQEASDKSLGRWKPEERHTDVWGQEMMDVLADAKSRFTLSLLFCSTQASEDWLVATHIDKSKYDLLYSVCWIKCCFLPGTSSQTHRNKALPAKWAYLSQLGWHINPYS